MAARKTTRKDESRVEKAIKARTSTKRSRI